MAQIGKEITVSYRNVPYAANIDYCRALELPYSSSFFYSTVISRCRIPPFLSGDDLGHDSSHRRFPSRSPHAQFDPRRQASQILREWWCGGGVVRHFSNVAYRIFDTQEPKPSEFMPEAVMTAVSKWTNRYTVGVGYDWGIRYG